MKNKELIEKLLRLDPEAEVEIAVKQYNKVYPVAYPKAFDVDNYRDGLIRIYATLPENMFTVERKVKK